MSAAPSDMIQAKTRRSGLSQTGSDINRQYYYLPGCRGPGHGTVPSAWLPGKNAAPKFSRHVCSCANKPSESTSWQWARRELLEEPRCVIYFRFPYGRLTLNRSRLN
eukprot:134986-Hanusia_phi.AAC.1